MGLAFELVESVDCPLQCGWTYPVPWKSKQTKRRERRNLPPFSCLIEELGCLTLSSALGLRDLVHWLTCSQVFRLGLNYTISFPRSSSSKKDGGVEKYALIFSFENIKITTICWTTIDRRMLEPTKERYPTSKEQRRSLQQNGRMSTIMLKSNSIPTRDSWRAQTKSSSHQDPGESSSDPHKRLSQTCLWKFKGLLRRCGSSVASHRDRVTYSSKLGGAACGVKSSWKKSPLALP